MARMSIDDMVGRDPRITMLSQVLGWSRRETVGCLVADVWPITYDQQTALISERVLDAAAGHVGFAAALIECELASRDRSGKVNIRGAKERIKYLGRKAEAGRQGGLKSAETRRKKLSKLQARGEADLKQRGSRPQAAGNPPSPVPDSAPDPVPAPDPENYVSRPLVGPIEVVGPVTDQVQPDLVLAPAPSPEPIALPKTGPSKPKAKRKDILATDVPPEALNLALKLSQAICANYPNGPHGAASPVTRDGAVRAWANTFRKIRELDNISWSDQLAVLEWSQRDPFWSQNILSADTFRKQYPRLMAKAMPRAGSGPAQNSNPRVGRIEPHTPADYVNDKAPWE